MATKGIPYGVSDFQLLSSEDYSPFPLLNTPPSFREIVVALDIGVVLRHGDEGQVRGAVREVLHWQPPDAGAEQLPDFEVQLCDGEPGAGGAGAVL